MPSISSIILLLVPATGTLAAGCAQDNCFRAFQNTVRSAQVQSVCASFSASSVTVTSGLPAFATASCTGNVVSRVSSACSCLATSSSSQSVTVTASPTLTTSSSVLSSSSVAATTSSTTSSVPETSSSSSSVAETTSSTSSTTSLEPTTSSSSSSVPETTSSTSSLEPTTSSSSSSVVVTSSSTSSAPTSSPTGFPNGPKICMNPELSCHNTTAVADLCCFNAPGGQLLQTQFWDTAPSTGPADSWTLHGLWPDHCDGTYDANCDPSREYTNITAILQSYGKTDLLTYMSKYWKDYQGNDESFWEHEWDKHGTCISTLEPSCYNGYTGQEEVADYFEIAVNLFKGLDSYTFLKNAGIVPSTSATYTLAQIQDALTAGHGYPVTVMCSNGALDEIWYHYNVLGSVQTGEFVATNPDGAKSDCPATGVSYLPKYQTTTPTPTSSGATSIPTATGSPYNGKGFLQAYTSGANKGCLISAGTWYTTGTCATYTAAPSGTGFTLTSSKGACTVSTAGTFSCAAGNAAGTVFTSVDGSLAYAGSSNFYAAAVPAGPVQQPVYTVAKPVAVNFVWMSV